MAITRALCSLENSSKCYNTLTSTRPTLPILYHGNPTDDAFMCTIQRVLKSSSFQDSSRQWRGMLHFFVSWSFGASDVLPRTRQTRARSTTKCSFAARCLWVIEFLETCQNPLDKLPATTLVRVMLLLFLPTLSMNLTSIWWLICLLRLRASLLTTMVMMYNYWKL